MPKKTQLPRQIVNFLKQHPTAQRREISDALGVSYQAVQKHLLKLEQDGRVQPGFLITEAWEKGKSEFWIFIETRYDRETTRKDADYQADLCRSIVETLTTHETFAEEVSYGSIRILLGGPWDIMLQVYAEDPNAVGRFVTRYLRVRPGIVRTSTAWALGERFGADR